MLLHFLQAQIKMFDFPFVPFVGRLNLRDLLILGISDLGEFLQELFEYPSRGRFNLKRLHLRDRISFILSLNDVVDVLQQLLFEILYFHDPLTIKADLLNI